VVRSDRSVVYLPAGDDQHLLRSCRDEGGERCVVVGRGRGGGSGRAVVDDREDELAVL
jgi:hypothetical protein